MKILSVLVLLFALCSAYEDWTRSFTANETQAYSYHLNPASTASCAITLTYVDATKVLDGTMTCTDLKDNITAMHYHDSSSYNIVTDIGAVVTDLVFTIPADPTVFPYTWSHTLTQAQADALCGDNYYINVHTIAQSGGEVRVNLVGMGVTCNIKDYTGAITSYGEAPTDGGIPPFCGDFIGGAVDGTTEGGCYVTLCYDGSDFIASGVCYGLIDISYAYIYYEYDSSYLYYLSSSTFPADCPFSFRVSSYSDYYIAKMVSDRASFTVTNTAGEEFKIGFTPADDEAFPANTKPCYPGTPEVTETALTCEYEYASFEYDDEVCSIGEVCGVYSIGDYDYRGCVSPSSCYTCSCTADYETEAAGYYACCSTDNCNSVSQAVLFCLTSEDSASSFSSGLFVAFFLALIMKWFN